MKLTSSNQVLNMLDTLYDNALEGLPGSETAVELAEDYLKDNGTVDEAIDSLINWQVAKCGATGFLTGLGGLITLPVAIPADLAANYYIQIRVVAAIAHMRGYDIKSDKLKSFLYIALIGDAAKDTLKNVGIKIGEALTKKLIQSISRETIKKINQAIGRRILTKFGEKGVLNLGKMIPLVGGFIGGGADAYYCNKVGNTAQEIFVKTSKSSKQAA
jgi:hypothetical protein